jgi:hypothetical protein
MFVGVCRVVRRGSLGSARAAHGFPHRPSRFEAGHDPRSSYRRAARPKASGMRVALLQTGMGIGGRRVWNSGDVPGWAVGAARPRVAEAIRPPGGGPSPVRPDTAHLRETAPRRGRAAALTAIQPMRYGSRLSGVRAHVGVIEDGREGSGPESARVVDDRCEGQMRMIRRGSGRGSRFATDRPRHGEAAGAREGRRVRIGSWIGHHRSDRRAGSLVRTCNGCRDVVSAHEVLRSR